MNKVVHILMCYYFLLVSNFLDQRMKYTQALRTRVSICVCSWFTLVRTMAQVVKYNAIRKKLDSLC